MNDLEKQVLGRMDSEGVKFRQMKTYDLTDAQKEPIDAHKEAKLSEFVPSGRVTWNTNKTTPQKPKGRKQAKEGEEIGENNIECDMLMHVLELSNGREEIALFDSILKGVQVDFTLLNPSLVDEKFTTDVMLQPQDILHIEIAETPDSLPRKLFQLERLFIHFDEFDEVGQPVAKVAVICLNGEKTLYDEAVKLALEQIKEETQWVILQKIPVYVLYTPNRNVYRSLYEIEKQLIAVHEEMATNQDALATKQDSLATKQDALRKEMATKQDALATKLDKILAMVSTTAVVGVGLIAMVATRSSGYHRT
jgi:hypothetical protein